MTCQGFRVFRSTSSQDQSEKFIFDPAVESDELFDILRMAYPDLKTHSERKMQAVIEFLMQEREEYLKVIPDIPDYSDTAILGLNEMTQFTADETMSNINTSMQSDAMSWPSPTSPQLSVAATSIATPASASSQPMTASTSSSSNLTSSIHVWDASTTKPVKVPKRRCMTEQEKKEYRQRRALGSCASCKQRRRKCRHMQQESVVESRVSKHRKAETTQSSIPTPSSSSTTSYLTPSPKDSLAIMDESEINFDNAEADRIFQEVAYSDPFEDFTMNTAFFPENNTNRMRQVKSSQQHSLFHDTWDRQDITALEQGYSNSFSYTGDLHSPSTPGASPHTQQSWSPDPQSGNNGYIANFDDSGTHVSSGNYLEQEGYIQRDVQSYRSTRMRRHTPALIQDSSLSRQLAVDSPVAVAVDTMATHSTDARSLYNSRVNLGQQTASQVLQRPSQAQLSHLSVSPDCYCDDSPRTDRTVNLQVQNPAPVSDNHRQSNGYRTLLANENSAQEHTVYSQQPEYVSVHSGPTRSTKQPVQSMNSLYQMSDVTQRTILAEGTIDNVKSKIQQLPRSVGRPLQTSASNHYLVLGDSQKLEIGVKLNATPTHVHQEQNEHLSTISVGITISLDGPRRSKSLPIFHALSSLLQDAVLYRAFYLSCAMWLVYYSLSTVYALSKLMECFSQARSVVQQILVQTFSRKSSHQDHRHTNSFTKHHRSEDQATRALKKSGPSILFQQSSRQVICAPV